MSAMEILAWGGWSAKLMLGFAVAIALVRLAAGPTLLDRAITLEFLVVVLIGLFIVMAGTSETGIMLDVAAVAALVGFISTVGFARYVDGRNSASREKGGERNQ